MKYIISTTDIPLESNCSNTFIYLNNKYLSDKKNSIFIDSINMCQSEKIIANNNINSIASIILTSLATRLNNIHNVSYSERYWGILIGHWIYRYVSIMLNRYLVIKKVLDMYEISGYTKLVGNRRLVIAQNSQEFVLNTDDKEWNEKVFEELLLKISELRFPGKKITPFIINSNQNLEKFIDYNKNTFSKTRRYILNKISKLTFLISRNDDAVIVNSYLPRYQEIMLFFKLNQIPHYWYSPNLKHILPDMQLRASLAKLESATADDSLNEFLNILNSMVWRLLPVSFLEGYKNIVELSTKQRFPKNPKFIFTSNNFDTDEIFKSWIAEKTEKGIAYYVGQHGNNYGAHYALGRESTPERRFSTKFITWGWDDGAINNVIGFNFKVALQKRVSNEHGKLLLVEESRHNMIRPYDISTDNIVYKNDQYSFVMALLPNIRKSTHVRLCADNVLHKERLDLEWMQKIPEVSIDLGRKPIQRLIKKSRLVVYSYDSTGLLESLSLNMPTIAFWSGGLDHLLDEAKPFYRYLVDAKIVHFSPESASAMINKIWGSIPDWWLSKEVQFARKMFIEKYSRSCDDPINELRNLLLNN